MKLSIGTWNVCTMLDNDTRPKRRPALICKELQKYNIDIAALQDTRTEGQGQIREESHTIFWRGKTGERREAGVAFAVSNKLDAKLASLPKGLSERLMSLRLPLANKNFLTLIFVYAPTMTYSVQDKEAFYEELNRAVEDVPKADKLIVLGDFNARVGSDFRTYDGVIGKFGKGGTNSNGVLLSNVCVQRSLSITNTYFNQPDHHYYSWMHPRSKHFHLLDYILVRSSHLNEVTVTRAMRGAECSTDHYLIRGKVHLQLQFPRKKSSSTIPKKLDVKQLHSTDYRTALRQSLRKPLEELRMSTQVDVNSTWNSLKHTILDAATEVLGHPSRSSPDWFSESQDKILPLLAEKQKAYNQHLSDNSAGSKKLLSDARSKLQREIRKLKNMWWDKKADELQSLADAGDSHGLFSALKSVYGPRTSTLTPVKSADDSCLFTDLSDITTHWREHFNKLLNQQGSAREDATSTLMAHPTRHELDEPITSAEVEKALKQTQSGKSPGSDGIPSYVLKHGGQLIVEHLLHLYNHCWEQEQLPQDFKDALIVTIYKKKGDRSDCGNHRGISLLSIAGKIFAKVLLNRLKHVSENVLPESQCGFRAGRSTPGATHFQVPVISSVGSVDGCVGLEPVW